MQPLGQSPDIVIRPSIINITIPSIPPPLVDFEDEKSEEMPILMRSNAIIIYNNEDEDEKSEEMPILMRSNI